MSDGFIVRRGVSLPRIPEIEEGLIAMFLGTSTNIPDG
jgi:hypothetical protein